LLLCVILKTLKIEKQKQKSKKNADSVVTRSGAIAEIKSIPV